MNYLIVLFVLGLLIIIGTVGIIINQGWLWLYRGSDEFKVYFKSMKGDWNTNPKISHYAGEGHLFYNTKKQYWSWKVSDIIFTSHSDYSTFVDYMKDWFNNSYTFTMKVIRDSSNNLIEWDGDNTSYTVALPKDAIKGVEKISPGDGSIYVISLFVMEQCG